MVARRQDGAVHAAQEGPSWTSVGFFHRREESERGERFQQSLFLSDNPAHLAHRIHAIKAVDGRSCDDLREAVRPVMFVPRGFAPQPSRPPIHVKDPLAANCGKTNQPRLMASPLTIAASVTRTTKAR
jgi:hypothetical protein